MSGHGRSRPGGSHGGGGRGRRTWRVLTNDQQVRSRNGGSVRRLVAGRQTSLLVDNCDLDPDADRRDGL